MMLYTWSTLLPLYPEAEVDYEPVEESLLFDGSTFEDMVCIEISIIDDVFSEPTEQFSVSLINSGPNVILNQDTSTSLIYIKSTLTLPSKIIVVNDSRNILM